MKHCFVLWSQSHFNSLSIHCECHADNFDYVIVRNKSNCVVNVIAGVAIEGFWES